MKHIAFLVVSLIACVAFGMNLPVSWENDQFQISLPEGWQAYNQNEALSGRAGPQGIIIFSAEPVTAGGRLTADPEILIRLDRGEVASFFVERLAAERGASCGKLSRTAIYNLGVRISQDPSISEMRKYFATGLGLKHTDFTLSGCVGARFLVDTGKKGTEANWIIDVRAVSDGQATYLFTLRNNAIHYDRNLAYFESSLATLKLKQVNAR